MKEHGRFSSMKGLFVLFLMLTVGILQGQTIFTGPANGDWFTDTNWSNGLPTSGNNATIPGGASALINAPLTVNFNIDNFGSITNSSILTVSNPISSGGAFANSGTMTINAGISFTAAGGFNNSGTIVNKGSFNCNSAPFINTATGIVNNESDWQQLVAFTNDGTLSNKIGVFTCPQIFTNNKTVENLTGATFKVDFGGAFTNAVGSSLTNGGNFQNLSTFTNMTTVTNTGFFINNGTHNCNGVFNNESSARFESSATVNVVGTWNNKTSATTQSAFRFNILAAGVFNNLGTFQNLDQIDVKLNGSFNNETGSTTNLLFGSSILNAGVFTVKASSLISSNGTINNSKTFNVLGTIESNNGSQIINSDAFTINGLVKVANIFTNNGILTIDGSLENNAGGVITNTATMTVNKPGRLSNSSDVFNRVGASLTNNGTVFNVVRITNEGSFTNNAYLSLAGDLLNRLGGSFNNTEVVEIRDGSIVNEGSLTNGKTIIVRACGILSNRTTLTNNGRIENGGVVFQKGTIAVNPIVNIGGLIQVGASSNAPSVCKPTVQAGTDLNGDAKVDAPAVVTKGFGIDSCFGVQYFVDGVNRRTYTCVNVGQTLTVPVRLLFRTNDELTCTTAVTVFDGVAPLISNCPQDVAVLNTVNTAPYSWSAIAATDNCGGTPIITSTVASGSVFNAGITEVVITAKDASNNAADCRFKVTVVQVISSATCTTLDVTAPVISNCPANITLNTSGSGAIAVWNTPSVTDACYPIVVKVSRPSGSFFPSGTTTVVYTATDANNNNSTCSFSVTVNGAPDFCTIDNIKPIIRNCPPNFFGVSNAAINGAVAVWLTPSVSDNCSAPTLTSTAQSGAIFPNGTTAVNFTATDARGNASSCTFNVFVGVDPCPGDVAGPVLACPANVSVNTTTQTGIGTWAAPVPTDACGGITLVSTHSSGSPFALGATAVTYQASDKKGNKSTCIFTVTVINACLSDVTNPVISGCPANISIATGGTSAIVNWTAPTATDNCSAATLTSTRPSGSTFGLGATTVTYTATDINGNAATCSFTVTVTQDACATDVTAPVFACLANRPAVPATAACGAMVSWVAPTVMDNCPGTPTVTVTSAPTAGLNSGSCFPVGVTTMTYRATDARGNIATCIFTVTVTANTCLTDAVPPVFANCPANQPAVTATGTCGATVSWTAPTATDNCPGTLTVVLTSAPTVGLTSGSCFPVGVTTLTYRATDAKGNVATCVFTVTVNAASTGFDPNKCYKIVNKATGKVLDVEGGSLANFARIFQWTLHGGANQQWQLTKLTNGFYEIKNRKSDKLLDIVGTGGNCANGVKTEQYINDNTGSQQWNLVRQADGSYKMINRTCNKTLKVEGGNPADGAPVELYDDFGAEYFKWFIIEIPCAQTMCTTNGGVIHERWTNRVPTWTSPIQIPTTSPNTITTTVPSDFKMPVFNSADNYISRARGYIKPTTTGNYIFNVTGDDFTELWLSTTNRSANIIKIAHHYGYTSPTEYTKYPTQTSVSITLQAGQLYYIELRHIEGGGGDFYQVQWKKPGSTTFSIIPSANLAMPCSNTQQTALSANVFTFEAKADINQAKLQWVSNGGYKNDYFKVERLDATGNFQTLDVVNAHTGDETLNTFNYTDAHPIEGENHYRITTIPIEGTPQYSDIKQLFFGKMGDINVFPNPADAFIDIDLRLYENKPVTIYVYNALGKMLKRLSVEKASATPQRLNIEDLNTGSYLIRVQTEGKRDVLKQVKIAK